ncbi:hypothetical protein [Pseudomonas fluorescens]|uniref:Uncharacterized protein n=1 Tax=Pseudomonas fluorescens TaxID=294 RepID=A0A5E7P5R9_PSEFL|nr:hypothetical protein [Pseudomonas fluorescens]VVP44150.1 hypothetical protein PS847_05004 [Pseudomonas fluorescens]
MHKKYSWLFLSVLFPLVLFTASPWWGAFFTDKKELSYQTLLKRDISADEKISEQWPGIAISYEGKDVSKGSVLTLEISNTGKVPIQRVDFDSSIIIHVSDASSIISYKVLDSSPANLGVTVSTVKEGLGVDKLLLNPGEGFLLQIFSIAPLKILDVTARVSGISEVTEVKQVERNGVYVKYVSSVDFGRTMEKQIFSIPLSIIILGSIASLLGTLINAAQAIATDKYLGKAVYGCISATLYLATLTGLKLLMTHGQQVGMNKYFLATLISVSALIIAGSSFYLRNRINTPNPE